MRQIVGSGAMLLFLLSSAADAQISVASTSPGNVQVQAGGSAVRMTLDGAQLTSVTTVRFLQAGRSVSGLSGALQTAQLLAGGTSRLIVDVRADRLVPTGTYQMQLVAGTQGVILPTPIVVLSGLPQPIDQTSTQLPQQQPQVAGTITVPAPSIASATPSMVQIKSEGPAQSVILTGSLLNQVVGAYARRNGNRVYTGIRTELVPSTDAARREIRVSAYGTGGPWDTPLDLVLEYTIGSTPLRAPDPLPTPVRITAAPPPNVDLVVTSCTVTGTVARATIRNNGSEGATFPYFNPIVAYKMTPGSQYLVDFDQTGPFATPAGGYHIPAGGTVDLQLSVRYSNGAALTEFTWIVDPKNVVAESNATNNERTCRSATAPTAGSVLDLGLSEISAKPTVGPPSTIFEFTVVLKNLGNVTVPGSGYYIACTIDNAVFGGFYMYSKQLAPGETHTERLQTKGYSAPGTHVFECIVDKSNTLTESTRNNNARSLVFTVTN